MDLYLLYESSVGYTLFKKDEFDETASKVKQFQKSIESYESFSKIVELEAVDLFSNADKALQNSIQIAKGEISEDLSAFIESHLPKYNPKKPKFSLAVQDKVLAAAILEKFGIVCKTNPSIFELFRGIRTHFESFLKHNTSSSSTLEIEKAQLGLAHSYSRNKIQFDVNREDKPIQQSLALIKVIDNNINLLSMRVKEWYSWHFPELSKIVSDNKAFVRLMLYIGNRSTLNEESLQEIEEIVLDGSIAQSVYDAAKSSMGQDLNEMDETELKLLCNKIIDHMDYRDELNEYLSQKMVDVAPNLNALVGENVGATLITKAGGLQNLAKYPASTIQILGAEKALFRALKSKGNTPKYGLLYNCSFIGKAKGKDKGKISRYLANKCAIASRLDYFLLNPTKSFGEKMREQVETRLHCLETGEEAPKNDDVMNEVMEELKEMNLYYDSANEFQSKKRKEKKKKSKKDKSKSKSKDKKKKKSIEVEVEESSDSEEKLAKVQKSKKKKKTD